MTIRMKFREVPPGFGDRFPDGDYTVGRGADPRGRLVDVQKGHSEVAAGARKPRKSIRRKTVVRPAAE